MKQRNLLLGLGVNRSSAIRFASVAGGAGETEVLEESFATGRERHDVFDFKDGDGGGLQQPQTVDQVERPWLPQFRELPHPHSVHLRQAETQTVLKSPTKIGEEPKTKKSGFFKKPGF